MSGDELKMLQIQKTIAKDFEGSDEKAVKHGC